MNSYRNVSFKISDFHPTVNHNWRSTEYHASGIPDSARVEVEQSVYGKTAEPLDLCLRTAPTCLTLTVRQIKERPTTRWRVLRAAALGTRSSANQSKELRQ